MSIKNILIQLPEKSLTQCEAEVLTLAAQGAQRPEIAATLEISEETVKAYFGRVCRKLEG